MDSNRIPIEFRFVFQLHFNCMRVFKAFQLRYPSENPIGVIVADGRVATDSVEVRTDTIYETTKCVIVYVPIYFILNAHSSVRS